MPETLTDEQILDLDDGPSSEVADASEITSPTSLDESAPSNQTETELSQAETPTPPAQTAKQPPVKEGAEQAASDATALKELFPQGVDQAKAAHQKAEQFDRADAAFLGSNYPAMAETFTEMFSENPRALGEAILLGRQWLEEHSPEQLNEFSRLVVGEELQEQGVWDFLEAAFAQATTQQEQAAWNQLAVFLQGHYGVGPITAETQAATWNEYRSSADAVLTEFVEGELRGAMPAEFSSIPSQLQGELLKAAHLAIQDSISKDERLGQAVRDALGRGISRKAGVKAINLLGARARHLAPLVVRRLTEQYHDLFGQAAQAHARNVATKPSQAASAAPAPRNLAEARSKGMTMGDILRAVEGERDESNPLGVEESRQMSDMDILNSSRAGQRRPTWRPENIFDEANL